MAAVNTFYAFLARKLEAGGSETTIYLDRITTRTGETISTSQFSTFGRGILTVNPDGDGETSYPEWCSFTAVDSSALSLTGVSRGLSALGNSTVTANKRFHPVGTPVVISFGVHNLQDLIDYTDSQIAALTVGSNTVSVGTAGESVSAGNIVYLKSDGKWWLTDADDTSTFIDKILGVAQGSGSVDGSITNGVLTKGIDTNQTGLTTGSEIFISNTPGGISESSGTVAKKIGVARSTTVFYFDQYFAKTNHKKVTSETSSATPTINTNNTDVHQLTAQAVAITNMSTNLTGNPSIWDILVIEITDASGSELSVTWGSSFIDGDIYNLPATVTASTTLRCVFSWDGSNWVIIGFA